MGGSFRSCGSTPADQRGALLLVLHHLAIDTVSWQILLPDLAAAWQAAQAGRDPRPDPVPTALARWANLVNAAAHDPVWAAQLPGWTRILSGPDPLLGSRPLDPARDVAGTALKLVRSMPGTLARLQGPLQASVNELLLCALALTVGEWRRRRDGLDESGLLADVEGHGREVSVADVDLSRTVGWLTSLYPVRIDPGRAPWPEVKSGAPIIGTVLRRVLQSLRDTPGNGIGYGLLRYLNPRTGSVLAALPAPQLGFNYLGRSAAADGSAVGGTSALDNTAGLADWAARTDLPRPAARDPELPLTHALQVTARIEDRKDESRLFVTWSWASGLLTHAQVAELADLWQEAVDGLCAHAGRPDAGRPDAGGRIRPGIFLDLDQDEIDDLEASLGSAR